MRRSASEIIRNLERRVAKLEKQAGNFKFNTMYYSSALGVNFYPLKKLKNGKIQGVQMDYRGKPKLMSHLDSDFSNLGMRLDNEISTKDEKKIVDYAQSRTASTRKDNTMRKTSSSKITGFTSQLKLSGRPTKMSWDSLDDLLESMEKSISLGYVVMDHNGYDARVDYRYVTMYEDGTHLVLVATPRRQDEDEQPKVDIRASLSDLLGSGATMQPVVDEFLRQVKKRLPFDV